MLLQTLVQRNILILATPALAGWTMLPMAQPGLVRAASVVWQCRIAEAAAPKTTAETVQIVQSARPLPAVLPRIAVAEKPFNLVSSYFVGAPSEMALFSPFPHAARAP